MIRLIGVGDNTTDTYIHMKQMFPGGNALNVAVLAKRLGYEAAYLGCVGKDERGELILSALNAEGVDTTHCRMISGAPTSYDKVELVHGDRVFVSHDPGAAAMIHLDGEDLDFVHGYDIVHTSIYSKLEAQLPELRKASRKLSFDFSHYTDQVYLEKVLPYSDVAFISLSDVPLAERESFVRSMATKGPKLVVATSGMQGSKVFDGTRFYHQDIVPIEVVDTLGAGDAFAACFLGETELGTPIPLAMQRAAFYAAKNCTHYGAFGYGKSY
jgi:fructoselysine 6-kinase